MKTISDLWNGNIAPCEHCGAQDPEANQLHRLMTRHTEWLDRELTLEQMEVFRKYMDCSEDYLLRMMELAFGEGLSHGIGLMVEVID